MNHEQRRGGYEALRYLFAKRYGRKQRAFRIAKKAIGSPSTAALFDGASVAAFAGAFLGCLTTLAFSAIGIVPCIASALATALLCGLLLFTRAAGLFADAFPPALYGGTFGGMTPVIWLSEGGVCHPATLIGPLFISLSSLCGLVFFLVAKLDIRSAAPFGSGYGGRLGAIAAVASFLFVELVGRFGTDVSRFRGIPTGIGVELWAVPLEYLASLGGILSTMFALRQRRVATAGIANRIFNASVVALVGLLAVHLGSPDATSTLEAFYSGCFLGMSTRERLKGSFQPLFGALVLSSTMLVLVRAILPGVGGSLGLAAFLTTALLVVFTRATARIRKNVDNDKHLDTKG